MPRLPRIRVEGSIHYITSCGLNNSELFKSHDDYIKYLHLIKEYKTTELKLFSYVLLPNHIHFLFEVHDEKCLSQFMHSVTSLYTKYFNSKYHRKGNLFKGRYRTLLVEKEPNLLRLTRYIHLHPRKAKIVEDIKTYPYSSYPYFLNIMDVPYKDGREVVEDGIQEIFRAIKENEKEKSYEKYVNAADEKEIESLHNAFYRKRIYGSPEFIKRVETCLEAKNNRNENESTKTDKVSNNKVIKRYKKAHLFRILAPVFVFTILLLLLTNFYFQKWNLALKEIEPIVIVKYEKISEPEPELIAEPKPIEAVEVVMREERPVIQQVHGTAQCPAKKQEQIVSEDLNGSAWLIELITKATEPAVEKERHELKFVEGKFMCTIVAGQEFPSSNYSKTIKDDGTLVWETMQTTENGSIAMWYGEWNGETMRGMLSYQPAQGENQNFSFVSVKKIKSG